MASFDWREFPEHPVLSARYGQGILGREEWQRMVSALPEIRMFKDVIDRDEWQGTVPALPSTPEQGELDPEELDRFLAAFDDFLRSLRLARTHSSACRVFVSHQRADVALAETIAYHATLAGFEYWLDVHDPLLTWANGLTLPPMVQSILIAAIIEMALLNCSHGITVQTTNAQHSLWVPYEFGRAKQRWLTSTQVASWFDNGMYAATTADYLKLGVCAQSTSEVVDWFARERRRCGCRTAHTTWRGGQVGQLPN